MGLLDDLLGQLAGGGTANPATNAPQTRGGGAGMEKIMLALVPVVLAMMARRRQGGAVGFDRSGGGGGLGDILGQVLGGGSGGGLGGLGGLLEQFQRGLRRSGTLVGERGKEPAPTRGRPGAGVRPRRPRGDRAPRRRERAGCLARALAAAARDGRPGDARRPGPGRLVAGGERRFARQTLRPRVTSLRRPAAAHQKGAHHGSDGFRPFCR